MHYKSKQIEYTSYLKKPSHFYYFLNSSAKHWPILIIFGVQHREKKLDANSYLVLPTSP